jgi:hypothetical protein
LISAFLLLACTFGVAGCGSAESKDSTTVITTWSSSTAPTVSGTSGLPAQPDSDGDHERDSGGKSNPIMDSP